MEFFEKKKQEEKEFLSLRDLLAKLLLCITNFLYQRKKKSRRRGIKCVKMYSNSFHYKYSFLNLKLF